MISSPLPSLATFADWLRTHDGHAEHHLPLLDRAESLLSGRSVSSHEEYGNLAAKLERWRYQHLNERLTRLTPMDRALADALDVAANRLAGRPARLPRDSLAAVQDPAWETGAAAEAVAGLDPEVPLADLIARARRLTREHFGRPAAVGSAAEKWRMLLYAPIYLSNECVNTCTYCGFSFPLDIRRRHLSVDEALEQAAILMDRGFRHLLLVAGDFPSRTTAGYYGRVLCGLAERGVWPGIEIAPQSTEAYAALVAAGACSLTLYQETYDLAVYAAEHLRGPKTSYAWRLEAMDRAAEAGMPRLGLGILLGLGEPQADFRAMLRHACYLAARFPGRTLAFSLPRIHDAPDGFRVPHPVDDETFVRFYCLLRAAFPEAELVLSTREPPALRDRLAEICITQLSAGSSTAPGGYSDDACGPSGEQFAVSDHRPPAEIGRRLAAAGFEPVWTLDRAAPRAPAEP